MVKSADRKIQPDFKQPTYFINNPNKMSSKRDQLARKKIALGAR